jgi:hypothetical protein
MRRLETGQNIRTRSNHWGIGKGYIILVGADDPNIGSGGLGFDAPGEEEPLELSHASSVLPTNAAPCRLLN